MSLNFQVISARNPWMLHSSLLFARMQAKIEIECVFYYYKSHPCISLSAQSFVIGVGYDGGGVVLHEAAEQ
jgi:hypothetical protein